MERLGLYEASLKAIKYHYINLPWKQSIEFNVKKKKKAQELILDSNLGHDLGKPV